MGILEEELGGTKLLGRLPLSNLFGGGDALHFGTTQVTLLVGMILYLLSLAKT